MEGLDKTTAEEVSGSFDFLDTRRLHNIWNVYATSWSLSSVAISWISLTSLAVDVVLTVVVVAVTLVRVWAAEHFFLLACRNEQQLTNI